MILKKIIWSIFIMSMLLASAAFAVEKSTNPNDYIFFDSGDTFRNGTKFTSPANNAFLETQGWVAGNPNIAIYSTAGNKFGNMSIDMTSSTTSFVNFNLGRTITGVTFQAAFFDTGETSGQRYGDVRWYNSADTEEGAIGYLNSISAGFYYFDTNDIAPKISTVARATGWHNITYEFINNGSSVNMYFDTALIYIDNLTSGGIKSFTVHNGDSPATAWRFDNILIWNGSINAQPNATVTIPPNITIFLPINNTEINKSEENYAYNASCIGTSLLNFTLKLFNSSNIFIINFSEGTSNALNLSGKYNISELATGLYQSNFTCNSITQTQNIFIVNNISDTQVFQPANITIISIANNSAINKSINTEINFSSYCINAASFSQNISNSSNTIAFYSNASAQVSNLSIIRILNISELGQGIYNTRYLCSDYTILDSEFFRFTITNTLIFPAAVPANETGLAITTCPSTIPNVMILGIIIFLALALILGGLAFNNPLIGLLGSMLLLFTSFYINACMTGIGLIMAGTGILLILGFVFAYLKK